MTVTHARRKSSPKSQSEKAADKKSKALERAGTAVIDGKPKKAEKILDAQKKGAAKKPSAAQAVEVLHEAHTIEAQVTAMDFKIESASEHLKSLKSQREVLVDKLRSEVRDMGQGRLPFQSGLARDKKKDAAYAKGPDPVQAAVEGKSTLDDTAKGNGSAAS